jgi:tetratricopeptide (TPR) repeat protein
MSSKSKNIKGLKPVIQVSGWQLKFQQAYAFFRKRQFSEAQLVCEEILKIQPKQSEVWDLLGIIAYLAHNSGRAVELISKAIELNLENTHFYLNRGNAFRALNQLVPALTDYDKAVSLKPDFAEVFYLRGNVLREMSKVDAAIESYQNAVEIKPNYGGTTQQPRQYLP